LAKGRFGNLAVLKA